MQIIINLTNFKCTFFYKRNMENTNHNRIDLELIEFAKRLSQSISSDNHDIEIWNNINLEEISNSIFHSRKSIKYIFRCFDKKIEGKPVKEKIIPLTLFFSLSCIEKLDKKIENE
jgi:hypothetical protein